MFAIRILCRFAASLVYALRPRGRRYIPESGPVIIVSNHVSYIDGILLLASCRRPIRFLVDAAFFRMPLVGSVLRFIGAIPIERGGGPKAIRSALDAARRRLHDGEVVGIFPEGRPTRSGSMLPFRRGFERLAERTGAVVIPAAIEHLWGSRFTYHSGRLFWRWSHRNPGPVTVAFGKPLPPGATPFQARQAVARLLAECARRRTRTIMPVHRRFVRVAARQPFRLCLIDPANDRRLNFGQAFAGCVCLAGWLKPRIGRHDKVGTWLPSSVGGVLANVALCLLRRTAVNLNYTAGPDAIRAAIRQCGMTHVVTSSKFLARMPFPEDAGVELIVLEEAAPAIPKWKKTFAFLQAVLLPGWMLEVLHGLHRHTAADVATIVFSSGSTGEPKGVILTHQNIAANVEAFLEHARFSIHDRVLGVLPFFHSFGYTVTLWGPLLVGGAALYHPDPRGAKEVGELSRLNRCTLMASTATFLRFYLRKCTPEDFRSMRLIVCGAEKLPVALAEEFAAKFGILPLEGYGCTELSPVVSVNMPDVTAGNFTQICSRAGTIGHPLPGIACRIVDPETAAELGPGEDGLLLATGPNVMAGYLGRDDLTAKAIRDEIWYVTGDIGHIDEDGFITLTGRLSRFAKIGGEMVPLERLEEEMHALLETNDRVVAVTALPDERRGERVVVLHLPMAKSPKQLCDGLAGRGLPNLWIPDARDFYAVESMPVLGSGKLDLQGLKQLAAERVGRA